MTNGKKKSKMEEEKKHGEQIKKIIRRSPKGFLRGGRGSRMNVLENGRRNNNIFVFYIT